MSIEITLDTLPAYLRGEGYPDQANEIEAAGKDAAELIVALIASKAQIPESAEAHLVCSQMARVIGQANA